MTADGGNTAIGTIDMNSHIIKNMADTLTNQDVASKNYVDKNAITTDDGVVSGDIKLSVGSDLVRSLGCNDLSAGKKFTLLLGVDTNMLTYSVPNSGLPVPIKIKTDVSFAILIDELPICVFGRDEILCSRPIDMDQHSIKNVKNPADRFDAVNKAYADHIKYKTATGNIPDTVMTHHTLFTFPAAKAFSSGKIQICEMWVERHQIKCSLLRGLAFTSFPEVCPYNILHCFPHQWLDSQFSPRLYRTIVIPFKHNRWTSFNFE